MKALLYVALLLALGAVGIGIYGLVETLPNYEYANSAMLAGPRYGENPRLHELTVLLRDDYRDTLSLQAMACFGLGGLAFVLGIVGLVKKHKGLGALVLLVAIAGGVMGGLLVP